MTVVHIITLKLFISLLAYNSFSTSYLLWDTYPICLGRDAEYKVKPLMCTLDSPIHDRYHYVPAVRQKSYSHYSTGTVTAALRDNITGFLVSSIYTARLLKCVSC